MKTTFLLLPLLTSCTPKQGVPDKTVDRFNTMSIDDMEMAYLSGDTATAMSAYYKLRAVEYSKKADSCSGVYFNQNWKNK